ncbi:uncharacterized protein LOC7473412 isoform X1 [Populus trichocarpa]|uniref:uncharacterized protein LOC7473412 isoform X1 n=1 Tax=Populus trichocarpa TaxID=3694 RepID=UPI002279A349|nr:uncharacterized protein LOC7473412 isoform X1 [Populus trichocarpa]
MGEALFDLEQLLKSQKVSYKILSFSSNPLLSSPIQMGSSLSLIFEALTLEEANILQTCKSKAVRHFTAGVITGAAVAWAATWKLSRFAQANISGGAAALFGFWRFNKSLDTCVDHILAMDGSRLQKELANIMANKYQDDPWSMHRLNKHFYSENVFVDSNSDRPIIRRRNRNFFVDDVAYGQRTHDSDSHNVSHVDSDVKRADVESKKVPMKPGADVMEDPLECIFGFMASVEEIHHPVASGKPARVLNRSQKRSHHRRRMRHRETSLDSEHL